MNLNEKIRHSRELIEMALEQYKNVKIAVSWGKDSMVVLHLALQVDPNIQAFTVLTDKKPRETFEYMDKMKLLWNLNLKEHQSREVVPKDLPYINPDECCRILKVEPTKEALEDVDCWITGLRNTEGKTREDYEELEVYDHIAKLNPILKWTEREIWQYLACYEIPIHKYYSLGYRSLGCTPCTKIVDESEEERAGRWSGTSKCGGECGIHTFMKKE